MNKKTMFSGLAVVMLFSAGFAVAADSASNSTQSGAQNQQTTGWQMMSNEERSEQRAKMRSATSREEREKIRAEHHEIMKQRAKEKGMTLPDNPRGGMGGGQGGGMGGGQGGRMEDAR